jgi:hypothetical protein
MPVFVPLIHKCESCGAEIETRSPLTYDWHVNLVAPSDWVRGGPVRFMNPPGGDGPRVWCDRVRCDAAFREVTAKLDRGG